MAVTVSSRPRQEADFRFTSQGWPRSGVGEVRELAVPAISGHTSDQEITAPMAGFRVQPTWADERSYATTLHCGRSRSCRSGRHPMHPVRLQFDQPNWRCRPTAELKVQQFNTTKPLFNRKNRRTRLNTRPWPRHHKLDHDTCCRRMWGTSS